MTGRARIIETKLDSVTYIFRFFKLQVLSLVLCLRMNICFSGSYYDDFSTEITILPLDVSLKSFVILLESLVLNFELKVKNLVCV